MRASPALHACFAIPRRSFEVAASFSLEPGERLSIFGPSGAGKTTCLEAIAGIVDLREGEVRLGGALVNVARRRSGRAPRREVLEPRARGVSLVRQPTTLFPHLTVSANIRYGLGRAGEQTAPRGVDELLSDVGLPGLGGAMPEALSGGQRQRVSLARALARPFLALLLDEPFSAVDAASRPALRRLAESATAKAGAVAVLVTHDLAEAQSFGDRIGVMDKGRLLQLAPGGDLVLRPASARVAALCGYEGFVGRADGRLFALHPDRFVRGALADRGLVLRGIVSNVRPFGARYACEVVSVDARLVPVCAGTGSLDGAPSPPVLVVHLDEAPWPGDPLEVTALAPPLVEP